MKTQVIDMCDGVTTWDVLDNNGKSVGIIQNVVVYNTKIARSTRQKVVGYDLEKHNGFSKYFGVDEYGSARAAFAAARRTAG